MMKQRRGKNNALRQIPEASNSTTEIQLHVVGPASLMLDCWRGSQTGDAYSNIIGRTIILYVESFTGDVQSLSLLRRNPTVLFP